MSLFDFFKGKPNPEPVRRPSVADQPRAHHYAMAHRALKSIGLDDPLFYLAVLASPKSGEFLESLFEQVCKKCADERAADFNSSDIKIHCLRVGGYPCAVAEMPAPIATAEAFFTALVVLKDLSPSSELDPDDLAARYFTLEKGFSEDGTPRTVMCEWTKESHLNYGTGPAPTLEAFAAQIERMIEAQSSLDE